MDRWIFLFWIPKSLLDRYLFHQPDTHREAFADDDPTLYTYLKWQHRGAVNASKITIKKTGDTMPVLIPIVRDQSAPSSAIELCDTVKWFSSEKGFGFVVAEDGGKDIFVHISILGKAGLREIAEGQKVLMMVQQGQKGREATSVKVLS